MLIFLKVFFCFFLLRFLGGFLITVFSKLVVSLKGLLRKECCFV